MLASKGFGVGTHIRRKVDKIEGVLSEVKGQTVFVKMMASSKIVKVDLNVILAGDWVSFVPRVQPTLMERLDQYQDHVDFNASSLASKIQLELCKLHKSMERGSEQPSALVRPPSWVWIAFSVSLPKSRTLVRYSTAQRRAETGGCPRGNAPVGSPSAFR